MLTVKAPAKINLFLEVLGKRDDGYHEISSIMQTVSLCDKLSFDLSADIKLQCTACELETDDNLALKAAKALKLAGSYKGGTRIGLEKQIPLDAGLGGGSSDAAATLHGLNKLWSLDMNREELAVIGSCIGSDVPFFIYGGVCEVKGRGEKVTMLPDAPGMWFVLLKPAMLKVGGKTRRLYGLLGEHHYTEDEYCSAAKAVFLESGRIDPGFMYNTFDAVAFDAYPGLEQYWRRFADAGARHIHLAGSGPMLFTMSYDEFEAKSVHDRLTADNIQSYLVTSLRREEIGY
jgi:4-diphosphocytidyl-2-C-methyl-D-erythritol kinase